MPAEEVLVTRKENTDTAYMSCGDFVQHGLRYPGEDIGCAHDRDEWGDVIDPINHPFMR